MNMYDKLNKDYPVDITQIKTSSDYCKKYYNKLFEDMDKQVIDEYKKLNKKLYSIFFILILGVLFLIGVSIITPIFIWTKSHSILSIIALVICGIIIFIISCIFVLDLITKWYSKLKNCDEKWDELYNIVSNDLYNDIYSCTCYEVFIDDDWITNNIIKQLIKNNVSSIDISNIAQWVLFESDGIGKTIKEYIKNNYNIELNIEDNICLFDIIEKNYIEKEN